MRYNRLNLPKSILDKLELMKTEIDTILTEAEAKISKPFNHIISFQFSGLVNSRGILSDGERSSFLNFILRYRGVPEYSELEIVEFDNEFQLTNSNVHIARLVLHEWRPVLVNEKDTVYYKNILKFLSEMFMRGSTSEGTMIKVFEKGDHQTDLTEKYLKYLSDCRKAIKHIINSIDLKYLYNGVLQHSDPGLYKRYEADNHNGEINYILLKNAFIVTQLKKIL